MSRRKRLRINANTAAGTAIPASCAAMTAAVSAWEISPARPKPRPAPTQKREARLKRSLPKRGRVAADRKIMRRIARQHLDQDDPKGWFEALYSAASGDSGIISWAEMAPNPNLVGWLEKQGVSEPGQTHPGFR